MHFTLEDLTAFKSAVFGIQGLNAQQASPVFQRMVAEIEPRLVFTEDGASIDWLVAVRTTAAALHSGERGTAQRHLDRVIQLAQRFLPAGAGARRPLPFMVNADLKRVAEGDWTRAVAAAEREDAKTTAIAAGSVVEAIALDIVERLAAPDRDRLRAHVNGRPVPERRNLWANEAEVNKWSPAYRFLVLGPIGLRIVAERTHAIGHELRDWRNDVHPDAARANPDFTAADGRLAIGLATKILEEVRAWHDAGATLVVP